MWKYKVGEEASDAFVFFFFFQLFICLSLNEYFVKRQFWSLNKFESLKEPNEIGIKFRVFFFFFEPNIFKFSYWNPQGLWGIKFPRNGYWSSKFSLIMFVCLVKNVHDEGLWFLNVKLFWVPEGAPTWENLGN